MDFLHWMVIFHKVHQSYFKTPVYGAPLLYNIIKLNEEKTERIKNILPERRYLKSMLRTTVLFNMEHRVSNYFRGFPFSPALKET